MSQSETTPLLAELREAATRGVKVRTDYLTGHPSYMPLTMAARAADEIERLRGLVIHYADQCGVPEEEVRRVQKL